jgi:hypothetical protein
MTSPAAATAKSPSFLEDIVDVFYAPAAVFERRRNGGFGAALVLFAVLMAVMFYAGRPVMQPMFDRQIAKVEANPNMSAEQKQTAIAMSKRFTEGPLPAVFAAIAATVSLFVTALTLWLVAKLVGSVATYGQSMMVTTFAWYPRLLLSAIVTGYSIATGREVASQFALGASPAAFLPDSASPMLAAALSRLDLGVLWTTALLGIGIAVVGRLKRGQGFTVAAIVWLLGGGIALITALREMNT